jgi:predicted nucleotidyltransferase
MKIGELLKVHREEILKIKVDIATENGLHQFIKARVLSEAVLL